MEQQYSHQSLGPKPYLTTPSYIDYLQVLNNNMKCPPYYTYNQEKSLPILYNYYQPNYPCLVEQCKINPRYQYWLTPQ